MSQSADKSTSEDPDYSMLEEHHEQNVPNQLDNDFIAYTMPQEVMNI